MIGTAATVVFFAVMLFIFGQSNRVVCRHQEPGRASCSVANVLLRVVPLPAWKLDGVLNATVQVDCNDGCSYRTALRTANGDSRPISEVWNDQQAHDNQMAAEINDFLQAADAPTLAIDNAPAAWVIWLLAGLAAMSIIIQAIVFFGQVARALFGARSVAGGTYR